MKTVKFKTNINCESCLKTVTPFLNELDNVSEWKVILDNPNKILEVSLENNDSKTVENAVKKAGFSIKEI